MWLKLCLLLIYVTFLFIIARLIEAITWYETGSLSRRLLDPMTLSVLKLKALLHQRGVTYDGVVEKSDLTQLVEATGPAMEDEVELSLSEEELNGEIIFQSGAHFYEQVEDGKDSVWIISVLMGESSHQRFISEAVWKSIRKTVSRFGVRAGVMDCSQYPRYCHSKGLKTPKLMLALPQDFKTKASIKLHPYNGLSRETSINKWIHEKLEEKITTIKSFKEFKTDWLTYSHSYFSPEIRTVIFTKEEVMPMFYSSLSLRFPGRVRFGTVDMNAPLSTELTSYFRNNSNLFGSLPYYLIITPETKLLYGRGQRGQYLTYEALEIYFKSLYPSLNDLFILSFIFVNVMSWFEFFEVQGSILKRSRKFLWCVIKYNILLIMMCLPLVGLFSLPNLDKLTMLGLKVIRIISTSSLANLIRKDIYYFTHHLIGLGISFLSYASFIGWIQFMRRGTRTEEDNNDEDLWNFNQMRTLEHLFPPADSIGQLETGLSRFGFIQSPTLWLRPSGSSDYIKNLPTWPFQIILLKSPKIIMDPALCEDSDNPAIKTKTDNKIEELTSNNLEICEKVEDENKKIVDDIQMNASFPIGYLPNTQCVICLDDYLCGIILCGLPCGHTFHEHCILSWLNRDNHFCPVCRWPADQRKNPILHLHCE